MNNEKIHKKNSELNLDGHSHEHSDASCNCGHSHSHEHSVDSCGCGHSHSHEHGEDSCGCGHSHSHKHGGDSCGCGHDHSHEAEKKEYIALGAGIVIVAVAMFMPNDVLKMLITLLGVITAGFRTFLDGIKSIAKFKFDETSLLTIAVIAAFALGEYFEAAAVTLLFQAGEILEGIAVSRSTKSVEALTNIRPESANIVDKGGIRAVKAQTVAMGSTILIKPGEKVPLDAVIENGETSLDTSALTGESVPVYAKAGDRVLSGSVNLNGAITCKTISTFDNSAASKIIEMVRDSAAKKGVTEKFISKFARVYTPIVVLLAVLTAILPPFLGLGSFSEWISRALVFLVASCPCAIVISIPLSFFAGIGAASRQGILIKGSKYLEILSRAKQVVMDKTGTITTGKLSVTDIISANGFSKDEIAALAAAAESRSNHPMAKAVLSYVGENTLKTDIKNYEETAGQGVSADIGEDKVLCGSLKLLQERGVDVSAFKSSDANIFVAKNGVLAGAITVSDTIRPEAQRAVAELKELGISKTVMLTGDNEEQAKKIKEKSGVDSFFAKLLPQDKVEHLEKIKRDGTTVFIGDGINDAPVLAMADAGVAMGFGTDAAIQAADVVLLIDKLTGMAQAVRISSRTMSLARFNMIFALLVKAVVLVLGVLGMAQMWMAVVADVGVSIICVLNATRALRFDGKAKQK